ncbi:MAG: PPC domain-containing protein, partial [Actinomycetota bacterium]
PEDYRINLGPGADLDDLTLVADGASASVGFLTEDGFRYVALPEGGGDIPMAIPSAAVIDGEIVVRSFTAPWNWGAGLTVQVQPGTPPAPSPLLTEPVYRNVDGEFGEPGIDRPGEGLPRFLESAGSFVIEPEELGGEPLVFEGSVGAQQHDAYSISLTEGQVIEINLDALRGDPYLELVDQNGELVAFNDDRVGGDLNSQIGYVVEVDGDYEIRPQDLGGNAIDYVMTVEVTS